MEKVSIGSKTFNLNNDVEITEGPFKGVRGKIIQVKHDLEQEKVFYNDLLIKTFDRRSSLLLEIKVDELNTIVVSPKYVESTTKTYLFTYLENDQVSRIIGLYEVEPNKVESFMKDLVKNLDLQITFGRRVLASPVDTLKLTLNDYPITDSLRDTLINDLRDPTK